MSEHTDHPLELTRLDTAIPRSCARIRDATFVIEQVVARCADEIRRLRAENHELRRLLDLPAKDSDSDGQAGCTPMHEAWKAQVRYLESQRLLEKTMAELLAKSNG